MDVLCLAPTVLGCVLFALIPSAMGSSPSRLLTVIGYVLSALFSSPLLVFCPGLRQSIPVRIILSGVPRDFLCSGSYRLFLLSSLALIAVLPAATLGNRFHCPGLCSVHLDPLRHL
jgi:hypothetical protein